MKKGLRFFLLLVVLAAPAMAAPRDDDPRGGRDIVSRIVRLVKHIVRAMEDGNVPVPPHP
jgi:hypothetical protein